MPLWTAANLQILCYLGCSLYELFNVLIYLLVVIVYHCVRAPVLGRCTIKSLFASLIAQQTIGSRLLVPSTFNEIGLERGPVVSLLRNGLEISIHNLAGHRVALNVHKQ